MTLHACINADLSLCDHSCHCVAFMFSLSLSQDPVDQEDNASLWWISQMTGQPLLFDPGSSRNNVTDCSLVTWMQDESLMQASAVQALLFNTPYIFFKGRYKFAATLQLAYIPHSSNWNVCLHKFVCQVDSLHPNGSNTRASSDSAVCMRKAAHYLLALKCDWAS